MNVPAVMICQCKKRLKCLVTCDQRKGLIKVHPRDLRESLGNKPCLIAFHLAILIEFSLEDPLALYHFASDRFWNYAEQFLFDKGL